MVKPPLGLVWIVRDEKTIIPMLVTKDGLWMFATKEAAKKMVGVLTKFVLLMSGILRYFRNWERSKLLTRRSLVSERYGRDTRHASQGQYEQYRNGKAFDEIG